MSFHSLFVLILNYFHNILINFLTPVIAPQRWVLILNVMHSTCIFIIRDEVEMDYILNRIVGVIVS
jgi:hypothetical protein